VSFERFTSDHANVEHAEHLVDRLGALAPVLLALPILLGALFGRILAILRA